MRFRMRGVDHESLSAVMRSIAAGSTVEPMRYAILARHTPHRSAIDLLFAIDKWAYVGGTIHTSAHCQDRYRSAANYPALVAAILLVAIPQSAPQLVSLQ